MTASIQHNHSAGPTAPSSGTRLPDAALRCWEAARRHWSTFLLLGDPVASPDPEIAQIHMGTREVGVNYPKLIEKGVLDCLEAVFAHEIGHHVRYPGSLTVDARLRILQKSLIPLENYSLINLFTDLLINERLGGAEGEQGPLRDQLVRVYQAFTAGAFALTEVLITEPAAEETPTQDDPSAKKAKRSKPPKAKRGKQPKAPKPVKSRQPAWKQDPAFIFYMAVYEELWQLEPGALMGQALDPFYLAFPDYRADAQLLVQNLFPLAPNLYTQFIYFLSVMSRYVKPLVGEEPVGSDPCRCGRGEPSAEDWADALTPTAAEREAIERALRERWIAPEQAKHWLDPRRLEGRIVGLPGSNTANAEKVPEVMAAYYRLQAERYLVRPPPQRTEGEAVVPTGTEDWEPGENVRDIDWLATFVERGGVLGGVAPLKRGRIAEYEGFDQPLWQARVEIYLDVSGSMPDPRFNFNAMTLAAQVLVSGAVRGGGWVRLLLYSGSPVQYWEWCRSELELSRFLMHYVGGGTVFPFGVLRDSVRECGEGIVRQPIRVIITDTDFDRNYDSNKANAGIFSEAAARSPHLVLLQHRPDAGCVARYRAAGASVVRIEQMTDFPKMAADLGFALFPDGCHGAFQA